MNIMDPVRERVAPVPFVRHLALQRSESKLQAKTKLSDEIATGVEELKSFELMVR